jgi:hypothetical protein
MEQQEAKQKLGSVNPRDEPQSARRFPWTSRSPLQPQPLELAHKHPGEIATLPMREQQPNPWIYAGILEALWLRPLDLRLALQSPQSLGALIASAEMLYSKSCADEPRDSGTRRSVHSHGEGKEEVKKQRRGDKTVAPLLSVDKSQCWSQFRQARVFLNLKIGKVRPSSYRSSAA